jgi:hypothetical protein
LQQIRNPFSVLHIGFASWYEFDVFGVGKHHLTPLLQYFWVHRVLPYLSD